MDRCSRSGKDTREPSSHHTANESCLQPSKDNYLCTRRLLCGFTPRLRLIWISLIVQMLQNLAAKLPIPPVEKGLSCSLHHTMMNVPRTTTIQALSFLQISMLTSNACQMRLEDHVSQHDHDILNPLKQLRHKLSTTCFPYC